MGEIEHAIQEFPGVAHAVVDTVSDGHGNKRWLLISERRYRKILKLQRICTAQISLAEAGKN